MGPLRRTVIDEGLFPKAYAVARKERSLRKFLFLALTLLTVMSATLTLPKPAEAACTWQCGLCGAVCPCATRCTGPLPPCPCG